jgi:hypothetical protein
LFRRLREYAAAEDKAGEKPTGCDASADGTIVHLRTPRILQSETSNRPMRDRLHQRIVDDNDRAKKTRWIPLCGMLAGSAAAACPAWLTSRRLAKVCEARGVREQHAEGELAALVSDAPYLTNSPEGAVETRRGRSAIEYRRPSGVLP